MNKKGAIGLFILFLVIIGIAAAAYVINKPSPSPTGSVISNPNNPYNIPEYKNTGKGDYGQLCLDEGYCDSGECQGGMCIHCGYFGETCCYNDLAGIQCERGSECHLGKCRATEDYTRDCGHVGYKPCYYNEYAKCYYGVYNPYSDICEACGDYEQPCCQDTVYQCDYGQCINGRCKRAENPSASSPPASAANTIPNTAPNPQDSPSDSTDSQTTDYCGKLDEPCCQDIRSLSPMGALTATPPCESGLECYAGYCVNGPEFETYQR